MALLQGHIGLYRENMKRSCLKPEGLDIWYVASSLSYVDRVTLDSYATVVVLVKERKRKIVKLEEPGIDKR